MQRATAPLTKTYVQELQKLKAEYTQSGDLKTALALDTMIKELEQPAGTGAAGSVPLSRMVSGQFKDWLATVVITEETGFRNSFTYDGKDVFSSKPDAPSPRAHQNVIIEPGKIFVPFTSTNATIVIDESLDKAQVTYSTGGKIRATITAKAK